MAILNLNAKLWLGETVKPSSVNKLSKELGVSHHKGGVSGSDLNYWISKKSNFGVQRIVQPKLSEAMTLIRDGSGFIPRYIWEVEDKSGTHFVFICPGLKKQFLVTNPHRLTTKGSYQNWRYFSEVELKKCFKKQRIGNRNYPWIWPIIA